MCPQHSHSTSRSIRAVLFDLDGTLYDRDQLIHALFSEQLHEFRAHFRSADLAGVLQRALALDEHGHGDKALLYATVAAEFGLSQEVCDLMLADFWTRYLRHCSDASPDTRDTLTILRQRGIKLGIVTNGGTELQRRKIRSLNIEAFFDTVVISEAEGVRKPDPVIFARALARVGVRAHEAAFVGDHPEADIAGASAAGLFPIWKRVPYWGSPAAHVLAVDQLSEILPVFLGPPGVSEDGRGSRP